MFLIKESDYEIEDMVQEFVESFEQSLVYNNIKEDEKFYYLVRYIGVCFALHQKSFHNKGNKFE